MTWRDRVPPQHMTSLCHDHSTYVVYTGATEFFTPSYVIEPVNSDRLHCIALTARLN